MHQVGNYYIIVPAYLSRYTLPYITVLLYFARSLRDNHINEVYYLRIKANCSLTESITVHSIERLAARRHICMY